MPFVGGVAFGTHAEDSLCYAAIVFVLIVIALFVWRAVAFVQDHKYRPNWQLHGQRFLTLFAMHAVPIPLFAVLSSPLNCHAGRVWGSTTLLCYSSGHLGVF